MPATLPTPPPAPDFLPTAESLPHVRRAQAILKAHPEVRQLFGRNRTSFVVLVVTLAAQMAIAIWLGGLGLSYWWLGAVIAYAFGAFAHLMLFTLVHESSHNLIFAGRRANIAAGILADVANVLPASVLYRDYHGKHHAHVGEYRLDLTMAFRREARWVGHSAPGKALWLLFYPVFLLFRTFRIENIDRSGIAVWLNLAASLTFDLAIVALGGWNGLLYLVFSLFFSAGLHPVGARLIQEHITLDTSQETFSYYGPLNKLLLNVGYHQEHHDFPGIPWDRLPALRRIAPEFYVNLRSHPSWTGLLFTFIFDRRYSLFSHIERVGADTRVG